MNRQLRQSSRQKRAGSRFADEDGETFSSRLLAVFIAVPLFEFSLYLGMALLFGSPRIAMNAWLSLTTIFHAVYCLVVIGVAVYGGMGGLTRLLGHLFFTHDESERNTTVTCLIWGAIGFATALAMLW